MLFQRLPTRQLDSRRGRLKPAEACPTTSARTGSSSVEVGRERWRRAPPRFPSPLIKPDVPISGIRLSDWFHRRLTYARPLALGAVIPPTSHTPVPLGTGGCLAKTPCAAFSRNSAHDHTRTHRLLYTPGPCSRS